MCKLFFLQFSSLFYRRSMIYCFMPEQDTSNMSPEEMAELQKQNCIYCKIAKGEIDSRKVFEDDKVLCVLEIFPVAKGHLLLLPKEHYPLLPVIPPQIQEHMFKIAKQITKALKAAMLVPNATIFVANGGVAGQQFPHFLMHLIPRENNDNLDNFNVPSKEAAPEELDRLQSAIKGKLGLTMRELKGHLDKLNKPAGQPAAVNPGQQPRSQQENPGQTSPSSQPVNPSNPVQQSQEPQGSGSLPAAQQALAQVLESNPEIRELIRKDPEGFKREMEKYPELRNLFQGVDIAKLSFALNQLKSDKGE
jgi:histidine triad (HIT) family protein